MDMKKRSYLNKLSKMTVVALLALGTWASGCGSDSNNLYYVALGNSLSVGVEADGMGNAAPTNNGYADQLLALIQQEFPNLQLKKFGCPSETTVTMLVGGGECKYSEGNQLDAGLQFIVDHQSEILLVTLDIGVNDILFSDCIDIDTLFVDQACLAELFPQIGNNLALILSKLFAAVDPSTIVIGMNYYNPFLATWLLGPQVQPFAIASAGLQQVFNEDVLGAAYAQLGFPVADVATAFNSTAFQPLVPFPAPPPNDMVPLNVATICKLTTNCIPPPGEADIHPTTEGYTVIANTFFALFQTLQ
jgi:hypothetical protein